MKWLALRIGGQKWSVFLVPPKSKFLLGIGKDAETDSVYGACDYEKCRIYINKTLEEGPREDALLHELLHALLHVSGADKVYKGGHKADERLVTALTPSLHRLLKDLGFRFPNVS